MTIRMNPDARRRMIGQAALNIAREPKGLSGVNHSTVAKRCPVETNTRLVRHYFATQNDLQVECVALDPTLRGAAVILGVVEA